MWRLNYGGSQIYTSRMIHQSIQDPDFEKVRTPTHGEVIYRRFDHVSTTFSEAKSGHIRS